ncbi:unnamed protein product, partial [Prorocentrum cordatum]
GSAPTLAAAPRPPPLCAPCASIEVGSDARGDLGEGKDPEPGAGPRLCDQCVEAAEARSWALSLALLVCGQAPPGAAEGGPAGLLWLWAAAAVALHLVVAACREEQTLPAARAPRAMAARGIADMSAEDSVGTFLEALRAGYGAKWGPVFEGFGLELVEDLLEAPADELAQLEDRLAAAGAGPAHIRKMRQAIGALRGEDPAAAGPSPPPAPAAARVPAAAGGAPRAQEPTLATAPNPFDSPRPEVHGQMFAASLRLTVAFTRPPFAASFFVARAEFACYLIVESFVLV